MKPYGTVDYRCRVCLKPRPKSGNHAPDSMCQECRRTTRAAQVRSPKQIAAQAIRAERHWQYRAMSKAEKAIQGPTSSWWLAKSREAFQAELAQQLPRLKVAGVG